MPEYVAKRLDPLPRLTRHDQRRSLPHFGNCFADSLETSLHGIIGLSVVLELHEIHALHVKEDRSRVLNNVLEPLQNVARRQPCDPYRSLSAAAHEQAQPLHLPCNPTISPSIAAAVPTARKHQSHRLKNPQTLSPQHRHRSPARRPRAQQTRIRTHQQPRATSTRVHIAGALFWLVRSPLPFNYKLHQPREPSCCGAPASLQTPAAPAHIPEA